MKYNQMNRRYFLQGLGGSLLALPILPSLIPKAHADLLGTEKFLVLIGAPHGGTGLNTDWYPAPIMDDWNANVLTQQKMYNAQPDAPEHVIRHTPLANLMTADPNHPNGNVDNGQARLSYVLGSFLNPYIDKMNFLRGIDGGLAYYGHSKAIYGGNIWFRSSDPKVLWPTLDQYLANSNKFYLNRNNISVPVFNMAGDASRRADGSLAPGIGGAVDKIYEKLFDKYEQNKTPQEIAKANEREFLIDRVKEEYDRLSKGAYGPARRISSEDKQTLEQHITLLHEVQAKYKNVINSCSDVTGPSNSVSVEFRHTSSVTDYERNIDMALELMALAFQCGATRLGYIMKTLIPSYKGDYHQDVAHHGGDRNQVLIHNRFHRWQAEKVVAKVLKKLDERTIGNGESILDRSLVAWTHEGGFAGHQFYSLGMTTFGSLGGFFKTGQYVDYRSKDNTGIMKKHWRDKANAAHIRPGIPIQRLWANILLGMGHVPSDFERFGRAGYGDTSINNYLDKNIKPYHPNTILKDLSTKLPVIT